MAGDIYFSAKDVKANRIGAIAALANAHYAKPALAARPRHRRRTGRAHERGGDQGLGRRGALVAGAAPRPTRSTGSTAPNRRPILCAYADARNLLGTTRKTTFTDATATATGGYTYYVTALNRTHQESAPSAGAVVTGSAAFSVVVDNAGAGFAASSSWGTSSFSAQLYGADYRFADPVAASDPAWFKAAIPSAGSYRVEVWYAANAGYNSATPYLVAASGGNQTVVVDQRTGGGQWRTLGTYTLDAGTYNVVGVSRWTSTTGYVIADAVRVTKVTS